MRPSHLLPVVALTFGLMALAPLARGDGQPETKPPRAAPKELPKGPPPAGEPKLPPSVTLPVTRVVLFNAGIAYFHREGDVTGDGRLDLRFDEADVNDLLKSLVLTDKDGGKVRAVTYDNRMPLDFTLKGFAVDVTENPTMGQLVHQVRGEKVEVTDKAGVMTTGQIVSVERPAVPATGPDPGESVNLLTEDGLQTVELKQLRKIKFVRAELQAEFKKALEVLATARGDNKKAVSVVFSGAGKRKVAVGYVLEAPLWKPSYRLSVDDKGAARIQGWATVENTTDEDWVNVKVGLVAGRPMTFQMDMYDPLFVPRPTVEPDLFASLRPPMYQGGLNPGGNMGIAMGGQQYLGGFGGNGANQLGGQATLGFGGGIAGVTGSTANLGFGGGIAGITGNPANLGVGGGGFQGGFQGGVGNLGGQFGLQGGPLGVQGSQGNSGGYLPRVPRPNLRTFYGNRLSYVDYVSRLRGNSPAASDDERPPVKTVNDPLDKEAGALAAADGALGDMFEYTIDEPITLAKQKSALLPLVNEVVEGSRVSIFNAATLEEHPLLGLKLLNKTKLHLAQGPVAVYDGGTFAGDARLPDLKPGEARLVSYAIDLGTEVVVRTGGTKSTVTNIATSEREAVFRSRSRRTTTYLIRNRNAADRTVVIEHPQTAEWKLIAPAKPDDQTRSYYRFDVPAKAGALATLAVTEESTGSDTHSIGTAAPAALPETGVAVWQRDAGTTITGVTVADGKVTTSSVRRRTTTYLIRNRDAADRTIVIEHTRTAPWKLVAPGKPDEPPQTFYRSDVPVKAGAQAVHEITEESDSTMSRQLVDQSHETLLYFVNLKAAKPAVREVFKKLVELREKVDEGNKAIADQQEALKEIAEDQERIRKNIDKAPKESDAFKRYLKKFDEQETVIEKHQARIKELKAELAKHVKALKDFAETAKAE
ncbi:DUF4139 domain-containing protein [Frigoriglobus tundricola]|uniref:DUF4139 domain-containing protein n=1 Tax=Frigoriglobus tundricola TaxID=2774151 RepID=A0A6M5YQ28_9BACT|nr:DUF4139 domain-containing protein [Frigoriglobus tundricola]QJW96028.1 hypothetical protein FTUN_3582 [Frigoriglobus tundricola]